MGIKSITADIWQKRPTEKVWQKPKKCERAKVYIQRETKGKENWVQQSKSKINRKVDNTKYGNLENSEGIGRQSLRRRKRGIC